MMNAKWSFETFENLQIINRRNWIAMDLGLDRAEKAVLAAKEAAEQIGVIFVASPLFFEIFGHLSILKEWSSGEVLHCRNGFRSKSGGVCSHGWMSGKSKSVIAQKGFF